MVHASPQPLLQDGGGKGSARSASSMRFLVARDLVFMPLFVAWYFAQAKFAEQPVVAAPVAQTPAAALVLQGLLAAVAVAVLIQQVCMTPPEPNDTMMVGVMSYIGRWVFLTRHCLALQAIHLLLSLAAGVSGSARLLHLTEGVAVWIGALGWFVTIQFFSLVYRHPDFKERCLHYAMRDPPVNLKLRASLNHSPAIVLAILDVTLARDHEALRSNCSIVKSLELSVAYAVFYFALLAVNYYATGYWPYPFMRSFTCTKWVIFFFTQTGITVAFCLSEWGVSLLPVA